MKREREREISNKGDENTAGGEQEWVMWVEKLFDSWDWVENFEYLENRRLRSEFPHVRKLGYFICDLYIYFDRLWQVFPCSYHETKFNP